MIQQNDLFAGQLAAPAARSTMNGKPVFTVPSKTVLNLESGFAHKLLCDGPTFSTGTACVYSCAFCYVPDMMRKQGPWLERHGVSGKHEDIVIRRENAIALLREELHRPKARALADKPLVIYSSPSVDVAGNMDLVRETVAACKVILQETQWHIRLLSKSNLLPHLARQLCDEVANDVAWPVTTREIKARMIFGVSTGTLDDRFAQAFEAGAPLVSKRIASLHWLQDNGFRTYGMICPSLPQRDYNAFARDMAKAIRAPLCEHVWGEVINLRGESFTRTLDALRAGGFTWEATAQERVSRDKQAWEDYARETFLAHARVYAHGKGPDKTPKLRFLQYPAAGTASWWEQNVNKGAILL